MHGLEGNKIFAAILFGIFIALGVVFLPRILNEMDHLIGFVQDPEHFREYEESHVLCDEATGKHKIIPGFCMIPESPRPEAPVKPFLLQLAEADPIAAASLTQKTCGGCHVFTEETGPAKAGPNLWGVVNADIASKGSYGSYSAALSSLEGAWSYDALNQFVLAPGGYAPGTKMSYAGQADQSKRALYVAYLRSLATDPAPLPSADELGTLQAEYDAALAQFEIDLAEWEGGN